MNAFAQMDAMLAEMDTVPVSSPVDDIPVPETVAPSSPVAVTPIDTTPLNTVTVTVPNSAGGYATLNLIRFGDGFTGPQGEYYPTFPSSMQLMLMYGQ